MFTETQWDHEVDVVCIGAEGGVLAAGLVAANAGSRRLSGHLGARVAGLTWPRR